MEQYVNLYVEFPIGSFVYVKTDRDQVKCQVTRFTVSENCNIVYEVMGDGNASWCYGFELSKERDVLMTSTN